MCGLAGVLDPRREHDSASMRGLVERMTATLVHRGPDELGIHLEPGIALGHRRLSIIDRAAGQQPMANEDGEVTTVFNGEIYNHDALRAELSSLGHRFRTRSDTEVIVHAWEAWGERCVERFRGMFALAVWDRREQRLFLARDRLGIKPLCYAELPDGRLLFGSEIKALLACPELPRVLAPEAVEEYLAFGYIPDPRSLFAHVRKLPSGHTLTVRRGHAAGTPAPYWDVAFEPAAVAGGPNLAARAAELTERLGEAVRIRLIAEVPLGAFLSGGIDSSAVVAEMSALSERPVTACSIAFTDPRYDESGHARRVARHLGVVHHVETVDADRLDRIDELARLFDEPFADPSALPTYEVSRLARQHVTVALSGDGGDEVFAGYRRYRGYAREAQLRRWLPEAACRSVLGPLARLYPKADRAPRPLRARATLEALAADPIGGYLRSVAIVDDATRRRIRSSELARALQGYRADRVLRRHAAAAPDRAAARDPIGLAQYLDLKTWLPGDILTKVDRASMAHGLEVRVPLLDHQLVEWAARLPTAHKVRGGEGKRVLKQAAQRRVPRSVLERRKQGFDMPVAAWLRGPMRERMRDALLGERLLDTGYFHPAEVRALVDDHLSGRTDHARTLWALLMLEAFLRQQEGTAA